MKSIVLKQNTDFRRLYYRGKSQADPVLVTYVMRNRTGCCRFGITASKKIGNAVERNRARRVIRAAFQELEPSVQGNWDLVFVARSRTSRCKMQEIRRTMARQLKKAGVIR
ncbi:MAG: ribonuclease P protein component [Clostridiales bacterium]|nr:ribonuclease P protein component [Clostridiales bacterium]